MSASAKRILVVDDDEALRESICEVLEEDGYQAVSLDDGSSALGHLRSQAEKPDLILLDLMLPDMNGWRFREEQLRDPSIASIPVVVMTATRELQGIDAVDVVFKPMKLERLLAVVGRRTGRQEPASPRPTVRQAAPSEVDFGELRTPDPAAGWLSAEGPRAETMAEVSDALRTPLTLVLGPTEELLAGEHGPLADSQRAQLQLVRRNALRAQRLVGALVAPTPGDLAEPQAGPSPAPPGAAARPGIESGTWHEDLYDLFMHAPAPICVLRGRALTYEMANGEYFRMCGRDDVLGQPVVEVLPALEAQGGTGPLLEVMRSGRTFSHELAIRLDHGGGPQDAYWTCTWAPLRGHGGEVDRVVAICSEVTDQVLSRRRIEQSEARFRSIVTQVQAGIAQTDLSGRFSLVNDRFRELVGRSEAELRRLRVEDITHPEDVAVEQERLQALLAQGTPFTSEKRYVRPDGSIVWVQSSVSRLDDAEGRTQGIAAVTLDITQRKLAVGALQHSEERFRRIFETAEISIWEEDFSAVKALVEELRAEHGAGLREHLAANPAVARHAFCLIRARDVNPATLRMFGAAETGELLASLRAVLLPETEPLYLDVLMAIADERRLFTTEVALRTLSGRRLDVLLSMSVPAADETWERVLVTLVDISNRRVAEGEREARLAEAERALNFSETFVGILGHDLRNPLSAIRTGSELLLRRTRDERLVRPLERIRTSADRMTRMIAQILDLTRARLGGGIPVRPGPVDLRALAAQLVEEMENAAPQQIVLSATGDMEGAWDADRLAQAISNLLGNAVEHGAPSEPIRLTLDGSRKDRVSIQVRNAGAIPEALLPGLFDPFRGPESRSNHFQKSRGLGLGLYIVQQIVHAHDGTIAVQSSAAEGTRFSISLPRAAG